MYTKSFKELTKESIPKAGGKGANLGEMITADFRVPKGFVLTTNAYNNFVETYSLQEKILSLIKGSVSFDTEEIAKISKQIHDLFNRHVRCSYTLESIIALTVGIILRYSVETYSPTALAYPAKGT